MKKFSYLLLMTFLLFASGGYAQKAWDCAEESTSEIIPGEDHYYAIQQGFAPFNQSSFGYLNSSSNKVISQVNHSCIFNFIAVSEKVSRGETFKIYVLKNVATGKYLQEKDKSGSYYTSSVDRAFRFTARIAREVRDIDVNEDTEWHDYSDAVMGTRTKNGAFKEDGPCKGAAEAHHWVFCHPEKLYYINVNGNPGFAKYHASSNWLVHEATERPLSAFEKFILVFDEKFDGSFDSEKFPVGADPGCIEQAMYDKLKAVYDEADAATANSNLTDEQYDALRQKIVDVFAEYKNSIIRVAAGNYYVLDNFKKGFMLDNGSAFCNGAKDIPESWTVANSKYVWKAEADENTGRFYLKNVATNHYLTQNDKDITLANSPKSSFKLTQNTDFCFYFEGEQSKLVAADLYTGIVRTDVNPDYKICKWFLHSVKSEAIDALQDSIAQNILNKKLRKLVNTAHRDYNSLQYVNGLTFDGYYNKRGAGLVESFENCNATETKDGKPEYAFDGNAVTFYHTLWSDDKQAPKDDWHWVQLDLGKELQEIYLKVSKRYNMNKNNPTRFQIQAPAIGDDVDAPIWTDVLYEDTMVYDYATNYGGIVIDSSTYIGKIKLQRPVQHIRFAVTKTNANLLHGMGPTWHIGEMRVYDPAETVENPLYAMIPQNVKDKLLQCVSKAEAELEEKMATEETCTLLETALDEFWYAYPDPTKLSDAVSETQERIDASMEDDAAIGYYQPGAIKELQSVIDEVNKELNSGKLLKLDELLRLEDLLKAGIATFNSKLNVPKSGTVYLIKSGSLGEDGEPEPQTDSYMAALNADANSSVAWRYAEEEDITSRWNALWLLEKNENNLYSFKNLATGLYALNPYYNLNEEEYGTIEVNSTVHCSAEPTYFTLEGSLVPGQLVITLNDKRYVTANPSGFMTIYSSFTNRRSRFIFEEFTQDNFNASYRVDCQENKIQVLTLPVAVTGVFTEGGNGSAYKVIGKKNNVVHLDVYEDGEIIEAGEPFVVVTAENEKKVETMPLYDDLAALLDASYVYSPIVKNGLVSAPKRIKPGVGYGILSGKKILPTESFDEIMAGTGFFNKAIPETEKDGVLQLTMAGAITGEGTAVDNVIVMKNDYVDVYNIQGVKVLSHIKPNEAKKLLPSGIYIFDKTKVVIK